MAVPEQIPVVNYVADGVVKKFDVPFEYDQQSDLHVYVDGAEPTIDKYFFADNAFNFYIAPTINQDVKIKRITPKERDTDYNLHTNTVRPKALNTDFDRLWYVLQEVFSDVGGLSQAVQDEIIARIQGDEDLLNQLTAEISARMLGDEAVTEDLKNYVDQVIGAIINDPDFDGIDADKVNDASGETQQQVNYNGGSKWHSRVGGYKLNERVVLTNGDIVKSTIDGNTNDPNVDMVGWYNPQDKFVSVLDFEIVGDGSNEANKFNLAMNRARSRNVPLDLAGLTVDTGSAALSIDVPLKNGKLKGRYQFTTKVNLSDVEVEIVHPIGFYIKGTAANIIKSPILRNVKVKYADGVVPNDAYSVYAEYTNGLQIIGGEYEVIQLIKSPNYRIINATIDGKMRNNNELIHATYESSGGIIAFNRFINALDNIIDLYSSGAQTLFVHNQIENCGNRLGTVMELKITYSDVPENSSSVANGFARNIIISNNIFKNLKATHAVNTSVINIYSIDTRAVPSMTSADYISDIIVSDNIFDGFDTSGISSDIRFYCISAGRANNIKIHGNIAKGISKPNLAEQSAVVYLHETNDCSVINNKGCIDQCAGLTIQGVNNGLTISLNKFNKDTVTGFKPKFGLFLNQFTGSNSTVLNDPIVTDNDFEGSLRSVHGSLSQINRGIIDGKFVNDVWIGSINDSDVAIDVKNEIGSLNSIYLGGASVSSGNTLRKVHVSGTGVGTAMFLSNMQDTTVDGFKTKNLALSLNITGANSSNLDIRAPKQKNVTSMISFDASVTANNRATIHLSGLSATKEITEEIVIPSKSESSVLITGASNFVVGMTLAATYSVYANGAVFAANVTSANTIGVKIINMSDSSITIPVGMLKVRAV